MSTHTVLKSVYKVISELLIGAKLKVPLKVNAECITNTLKVTIDICTGYTGVGHYPLFLYNDLLILASA